VFGQALRRGDDVNLFGRRNRLALALRAAAEMHEGIEGRDQVATTAFCVWREASETVLQLDAAPRDIALINPVLRDGSLIDVLIQRLRESEGDDPRQDAAHALGAFGPGLSPQTALRVVDALVDVLGVDGGVRATAAWALGVLGPWLSRGASQRGASALLRRFATHDQWDTDTQAQALGSLARVLSQDAKGRIVSALVSSIVDSKDPGRRYSAADVLAELAPRLPPEIARRAVGDMLPNLQANFWHLDKSTAKALGALVAGLSHEAAEHAGRAFATVTFGDWRDRYMTTDLAEKLAALGREPLAEAAGRAADVSMEVLSHGRGKNRAVAASQLQRLVTVLPPDRVHRVADAFIDLLAGSGGDKSIRWFAADALLNLVETLPMGETGRFVAALVAVVARADADRYLRHHVAWALSDLAPRVASDAGERAVRAFLRCLSRPGEDLFVLGSVVRALSALVRTLPQDIVGRTADALLSLLARLERDKDLREKVVEALGRLGGRLSGETLDRTVETLLTLLARKAVDAFGRRLGHGEESRHVAYYAAEALSAHAPRLSRRLADRVVDALVVILSRDDDVRFPAIAALGVVGPRSSMAAASRAALAVAGVLSRHDSARGEAARAMVAIQAHGFRFIDGQLHSVLDLASTHLRDATRARSGG
jgi:hypothetical protein